MHYLSSPCPASLSAYSHAHSSHSVTLKLRQAGRLVADVLLLRLLLLLLLLLLLALEQALLQALLVLDLLDLHCNV